MSFYSDVGYRLTTGRKQRLAIKLADLATLTLLLSCPHLAFAAVTFNPTAGARYEHDSNLFALPDNDTFGPPGRPPGSSRSDSNLSYFEGLNINMLWGRQNLYLDGLARQVKYDHYSDLDHNAFSFGGHFKWELTSVFSGDFGYKQERRMAAFSTQEGLGTELHLENERNTTANFIIKVTPEWLVEPRAALRDEDAPQPGFPNLTLRENTEGVSIKYAGVANLKFGITADYLDGKLEGTDLAVTPTYTQKTAQLAADYEISGLSSFSGSIGYTKREQNNGVSDSALTGGLSYRRQITGKTSVNLEFSRAMNTYLAAGSTEIDTNLGGGIKWSATRKINAGIDYTYTRSKYNGEILPGAVSAGREDRSHNVSLAMDYSLFRWLYIRPYGTYQKRSSNQDQFVYHDTIWGVELGLKRPTDN